VQLTNSLLSLTTDPVSPERDQTRCERRKTSEMMGMVTPKVRRIVLLTDGWEGGAEVGVSVRCAAPVADA
jgi:hypothetical protein